MVFIEGPIDQGAPQFFFILRNLVIGEVTEVGWMVKDSLSLATSGESAELGQVLVWGTMIGTGIASSFTANGAGGFLGEEYIDAQTGDINNGMLAKALGNLIGRVATQFGWIEPDSMDFSFGDPPVIGGVKVGTGLSWAEVGQWIEAVQTGAARPGILFFLESPVTGLIGPTPAQEWVLTWVGFSIVKIPGPWWQIP